MGAACGEVLGAMKAINHGVQIPCVLKREAHWFTIHGLAFVLASQDSNWRSRESAILALGAVSHGCHAGLQPFLEGMIQMLLPALQDPRPMVRIITCWTLGRYSHWLFQGERLGHLGHVQSCEAGFKVDYYGKKPSYQIMYLSWKRVRTRDGATHMCAHSGIVHFARLHPTYLLTFRGISDQTCRQNVQVLRNAGKRAGRCLAKLSLAC